MPSYSNLDSRGESVPVSNPSTKQQELTAARLQGQECRRRNQGLMCRFFPDSDRRPVFRMDCLNIDDSRSSGVINLAVLLCIEPTRHRRKRQEKQNHQQQQYHGTVSVPIAFMGAGDIPEKADNMLALP